MTKQLSPLTSLLCVRGSMGGGSSLPVPPSLPAPGDPPERDDEEDIDRFPARAIGGTVIEARRQTISLTACIIRISCEISLMFRVIVKRLFTESVLWCTARLPQKASQVYIEVSQEGLRLLKFPSRDPLYSPFFFERIHS